MRREVGWRRDSWIVGVDEAGRGSIIGEMFVAAFAVPSGEVDLLGEAGVRDSKELGRTGRAKVYRRLASIGRFTVVTAKPREIDSYNLNKLTTRKVVEALSRLARILGGWRSIQAVYVDKYGDSAGLRDSLRRRGYKGLIIVEERADARYPVVGAASIVAKYLRDARIEALRRLYGVRGSGYPSDPATVEWLREVFERGERPSIIRYSWDTVKRLGGPWMRKRAATARALDEFMK